MTQTTNASTQPSTWDNIKTGWKDFKETAGHMWKGFRDNVVGYIPYIPKAIVASSIFLGGLMLLGQSGIISQGSMVDKFLGASSLSSPTVFAARLGLGLLLGATLSGVAGAFEAANKPSAATPSPVATVAAPQTGKGNAPKIEQHVTPSAPTHLPPVKTTATHKNMPGIGIG